uniref:Uncharacterized protein n=1 Tax=Physcomitrium patens TaxID=3218 RepID=A0A7I3Z686_PHYPA
MIIKLKNKLMIMNFKIIDACDMQIFIAKGGGSIIHSISNVIMTSLYIHNIKPSGPAYLQHQAQWTCLFITSSPVDLQIL